MTNGVIRLTFGTARRFDTFAERADVTEVDGVGELCTPRDVLCRGQRVDAVRAGDILVFGRAGAYGLTRQFLHAARLEFTHPVTGAPLTLASPLPDDLEAALRRAREGGPAHRT